MAAGLTTDNSLGAEDYAFEQETASFGEPLPLAAGHQAGEQPNVIVIFTEGTSARLLDCYDGAFPDVTPHFAAMAAQATVVDNYFNHTAATFRGTHGQLASCYPFSGGGGRFGWHKDTGMKYGNLAERSYQTLPKVLAARGYDTYFLSPHASADPYTDLLQMLGFGQVCTRESGADLLGREPDLAHDSLRDSDMYAELRAVLEQSESGEYTAAKVPQIRHMETAIPI